MSRAAVRAIPLLFTSMRIWADVCGIAPAALSAQSRTLDDELEYAELGRLLKCVCHGSGNQLATWGLPDGHVFGS